MSTPTPIETNVYDSSAAQASVSQANVGKFADIYEAMGYGAQTMGPTLAYSVPSTSGADVVSAAINAASGYPSGTMLASTTGSYGTSYGSTLGYSGTSYTSGLSAMTKATTTDNYDVNTMGADMIAQMQYDGISNLMLQTGIQQETQRWTTLSNTLAARHAAVTSMIRNIQA